MVSMASLLPPPGKKTREKGHQENGSTSLVVRDTMTNSELIPVTSKLPLAARREKLQLQRPDKSAVEALKSSTEMALDLILQDQLGKAPPPPKESIVTYKHSSLPGGQEQKLRIVEAEYDPLEPPRHKFVRTPDDLEVAETAVLRAPPARLSEAGRKAWVVPPSISQWKNKKGYVLPVEFRQGSKNSDLLASEGVVSNTGHASLASALAQAEAIQKEENETRQAEREHELERIELGKRETPDESAGVGSSSDRRNRDSKANDFESKNSEQVQFDSRLFHQAKRRRETYDEPLFAAQQAARTIYRPRARGDGANGGARQELGPVEFEKDED